jgi:hypothetical protein
MLRICAEARDEPFQISQRGFVPVVRAKLSLSQFDFRGRAPRADLGPPSSGSSYALSQLAKWCCTRTPVQHGSIPLKQGGQPVKFGVGGVYVGLQFRIVKLREEETKVIVLGTGHGRWISDARTVPEV